VIRLYTEKPRTFGWFDRNLLTAIAQLMAAAIQKARLHGQQVRSQQVTRQLHLAADVQRRMIPAEMPSLPRFEIAARYLPSFDLGGDFYDFIDFREDGGGGMGVAVGDVVGKGVAASLLMAAVRASLRAYAQDVYDLDEVIRRVNRALCRDTRDNEFATLWYGVLDPEEMRLTYSNGGHEPPLLLRDGRIQKLDAGGMIVGIDPQQQYERAIVHLQPEDRIFIYTDGLLDAFDAAQRRFGRPRAEDAFIQTGHLSAGEALNRIAWELHRHMGATPASDDTTMLIIRALPDATPA